MEAARAQGHREAVAEMVEHCAKGRWDSDPLKAWAGPQTNPKQLSNPRRLSNPTTPQVGNSSCRVEVP